MFSSSCFAVRSVESIGASMYTIAAYAIAGKMFPENIAFVYSVLETGNGVGNMIGPSAGGILFAIGGFYLPFVATGGVLLVLGFISIVSLPASATEVDENGDDDEPELPWSHFFRTTSEVWYIAIAEALCSIICSFPDPTISLYFEQLGLTDTTIIGMIFLIASVVYTVVCMAIGRVSDKYDSIVYWLMSSGAIVSAVSFIIMGPPSFLQQFIPPSVVMTSVGFTFVYVGVAMVVVPIPRAMMNAAYSVGYEDGMATSGMISGLYNCLWCLGGFTGPPLAGFLMERVGFEWGCAVMAVTCLAIAALLAIPAFSFCLKPCIAKKQYQYVILNEESDSSDGEDDDPN